MRPLAPSDLPRLLPGVRLRFDPVRQADVLLAPERAFDLDPNAVAVLRLVDGARSIAEIATALAAQYEAGQAEIEADILPMLGELAAKRVIET